MFLPMTGKTLAGIVLGRKGRIAIVGSDGDESHENIPLNSPQEKVFVIVLVGVTRIPV